MMQLSHHRNVVIHYGVRYEALLRRIARSKEDNFVWLISYCRSRLGPELTSLLNRFRKLRNGFSHNQCANTLRNVARFVDLINRIEEGLTEFLPGLKPEWLTESDLKQQIPNKEVVYVESADMPRGVLWGIALIASASVSALFVGGFTNKQSSDYTTGGLFGLFKQRHHDLHEQPNALFWIVIGAAFMIALFYIWHRRASIQSEHKRGRPNLTK